MANCSRCRAASNARLRLAPRAASRRRSAALLAAALPLLLRVAVLYHSQPDRAALAAPSAALVFRARAAAAPILLAGPFGGNRGALRARRVPLGLRRRAPAATAAAAALLLLLSFSRLADPAVHCSKWQKVGGKIMSHAP